MPSDQYGGQALDNMVRDGGGGMRRDEEG